MKAKTRRLTASALSVIAAALLGCSAALAVDRAEAAEAEPSAAHVMTTAEYGSDWESSPYGKDGWTVFSATGGTVYSNLYTENASYDAEAQSVALAGWANGDANTWLTTEDGKTLDAAEELRPGIDKWAFSARAWKELAAADGSLYKPGTEEKVFARLDGWDGGGKALEDTSISINKTSDAPLYVTVYLYSYVYTQITPESPVDFYVYHGANLTKNSGGTLDHYGEELLGKTSVTVGASYVTFLLEGAGEFQIVATKGTDESGATIGKAAPYLGGFFLDSEEPEGMTAAASFVQTTTEYGPDWESSPYGTSGWVLLGAEGQTSGTENDPKTIYSNIYAGNDSYDAETQSVVLSGRTNNDSNTWLTTSDGKGADPLPGTSPGIGKWAFTGRAWREASDAGNPDIYQSLYLPGTKTPIMARFDGWDGGGKALEDTSISIEKTTEDPLYVTVYLYAVNYTLITPESPVDFYVYYGANLTKNSEGTLDHYGRQLVGKTTITAGRSYVTFLLEGTGEFQIVATKGTDESGATIGKTAPYLGGFFLDRELYPAEAAAAQTDLTTAADGWEGVYGNDGYILFGYDAAGADENSRKIAYTKGVYTGTDASGKVAYTDASTAAGESCEFAVSTAGAALSGSFVSRYGIGTDVWTAGNSGDGESEFGKWGRILVENELAYPAAVGGRAHMLFGQTGTDKNSNIAFTVTETAVADGPLYVTVYGGNLPTGATEADVVRSVSLFRGYYTGNGTPAGNAVARGVFAQPYTTHYYVTFAISEAGDYTVSSASASGRSQGSVTALFFDKTAPAPETAGTYAIEYVLDGAGEDTVANPDNPVSYTYAEGVAALAAPTWTDPDTGFDGWYLDPDCSGMKVESIPAGLNVNLTLYAKFSRHFGISYSVGEGQNPPENPTSAPGGGVVSLLPATAPLHYTFEGWYTDPDFTAESRVDGEYTVTADVTFYAKYLEMPKFSISYQLDGGTNGAGNPDVYYPGFGVESFAPAEKEGYIFEGWYLEAAFETKVPALPATVEGEITLYAKFEKIPVKSDIVYVLDGGVNSRSNPAVYTEGEAMKLFGAEKEGYVFDGWYLDAEFTQKVTEISADATGKVTLYAKFTADSVVSDIVYVLDGGTNAASNPSSYTEGQGGTLAAATKEGYTFDGWYLDAEFTQRVTEISETWTGDVTLYAKFVSGSGTSSAGSPDDDSVGCGSAVGGAFAAAAVAALAVLVGKRRR